MTAQLTAQEEAQLSELLAECLAAMQQARKQIDQDHLETEESQARTWALLADMQGRFNVETIR